MHPHKVIAVIVPLLIVAFLFIKLVTIVHMPIFGGQWQGKGGGKTDVSDDHGPRLRSNRWAERPAACIFDIRACHAALSRVI